MIEYLIQIGDEELQAEFYGTPTINDVIDYVIDVMDLEDEGYFLVSYLGEDIHPGMLVSEVVEEPEDPLVFYDARTPEPEGTTDES